MTFSKLEMTIWMETGQLFRWNRNYGKIKIDVKNGFFGWKFGCAEWGWERIGWKMKMVSMMPSPRSRWCETITPNGTISTRIADRNYFLNWTADSMFASVRWLPISLAFSFFSFLHWISSLFPIWLPLNFHLRSSTLFWLQIRLRGSRLKSNGKLLGDFEDGNCLACVCHEPAWICYCWLWVCVAVANVYWLRLCLTIEMFASSVDKSQAFFRRHSWATHDFDTLILLIIIRRLI